MATKLYLRNTAGPGGYGAGELSAVLPVGTVNSGSGGPYLLSETKGTSQVFQGITTLAQTALQSGLYARWISEPLTGISQFDANTLTLAIATRETQTNANAFLAVSAYIAEADDSVRGYVYDNSSGLGAEWATPASGTGRVVTFAGSAVPGIVSTDRLVIEVWYRAAQAAATAYTDYILWDGATEPTEGSTAGDAASYISTPQDGLFGAAPPGALFQPSVAVYCQAG